MFIKPPAFSSDVVSGIFSPDTQYLRSIKLKIYQSGSTFADLENSIDVSDLHIVFKVTAGVASTLKTASIQIFNIAPKTIEFILQSNLIQLSAGYSSNIGVIFTGTIVSAFQGRNNGVDTYIDILAQDGSLYHNDAWLAGVLSKGSTIGQRFEAILNNAKTSVSTENLNIQLKLNGEQTKINSDNIDAKFAPGSTYNLPRGKVYFGLMKDPMRALASTIGANWFIDSDGLNVINLNIFQVNKSLLVEPLIINYQTGQVGIPYQNMNGMNTLKFF